jgi:hypothetical protein
MMDINSNCSVTINHLKEHAVAFYKSAAAPNLANAFQ